MTFNKTIINTAERARYLLGISYDLIQATLCAYKLPKLPIDR